MIPQAIGHDRPRRRAPAGTGPDPVLVSKADQVPDDEEVGGEPHLVDDLELVLDPLPHLLREWVPVALLGALIDELFQVGDLGLAGGDGELRQEDVAELEVHRGPLGHPQRVVAGTRVLVVGEQGPHLVPPS